MQIWLAVVAALISLWVAWMVLRRPLVLQYLFFVRFAIVVGFLQVAIPILAVWGPDGFGRLLGNLFILGPLPLAAVLLLGTVLSWVVMVTVTNAVRYAPVRFRVEPWQPPKWLRVIWAWRLVVFPSLALPTLAAVCAVSDLQWWEVTVAVVGGFGGAFFALAGSSIVAPRVPFLRRFAPPLHLWAPRGTGLYCVVSKAILRPTDASVDGPEQVQQEDDFWAGYKSQDGGWLAGHRVAAGFLIFSLLLYAFLYVFYHPDWGFALSLSWAAFPAWGYVLLLLIVAAWLLGGAAFFLDRYRLPALLVVLGFSFLAHLVVPYLWNDSDHYWTVEQKTQRAATLVDVAAADEPSGAKTPRVFVAVNGGGITASYWTARVLAGLQCHFGEDFARSLDVISAVSGGSVGILHYLGAWTGDPPRPPSHRELPGMVTAAGASSLDTSIWGLVYPDLWRVFGVAPYDQLKDRGWAIEQSWRRQLPQEARSRTLLGWRRLARAGHLPAVVLNATVIETGRPFLLSSLETLPTSPDDDNTDVWKSTFRRTFGETADVDLVTAARLSSTFPWVSPVTRARCRGSDPCLAFHLGDGGYYDNFGVMSLVEWLQGVAAGEVGDLEALKQRGVLIIEIRSSTLSDDAEPQGSWLASALGPLTGLMAVRTTGQRYRNETELDLIQKRLEAQGVETDRVVFELRTEAPLSWKLSDEEREIILAGWDEDPGDANGAGLAKIRSLLGLETSSCSLSFEP